MKKLAFAALLLATACTTRTAPSSAERTVWTCDHGAAFSVLANGDDVEVFAAGQTYHLHNVPEGNGVRYSNGQVSYWEHMDMGALEGAAGGPYANCQRGH